MATTPSTAKPLSTLVESYDSNSKPFPFLKLPAELRNAIYRECLVRGDHSFTILSEESPANAFPNREDLKLDTPKEAFDTTGVTSFTVLPYKFHGPSVLRVSRQLNEEGIRFLYGNNVFRFQSWQTAKVFATTCGVTNSSMLRHVEVPLPYMFDKNTQYTTIYDTYQVKTLVADAQRMLDGMISLQTLRFRIFIDVSTKAVAEVDQLLSHIPEACVVILKSIYAGMTYPGGCQHGDESPELPPPRVGWGPTWVDSAMRKFRIPHCLAECLERRGSSVADDFTTNQVEKEFLWLCCGKSVTGRKWMDDYEAYG
ncbi:MAG: hypothetical protein MMC33_010777 [Icmadophila ericetorum]|nr:hypothetical protein [Icmadophila ericetorum]